MVIAHKSAGNSKKPTSRKDYLKIPDLIIEAGKK
jgi:hypothetical protein